MKPLFHFTAQSGNKLTFCDKDFGFEFFDLDGYIYPYHTKPTTGEIHDYTKCSGCQQQHAKNLLGLIEKFDRFPNCCDQHKKLSNQDWFEKRNFEQVPVMVANKIMYTNQHIINHFESEDWYNEITHYIDYTFKSFGQFPKGCGEPFSLSSYLFAVKGMIKKQNSKKGKYAERKKKLLDFVEAYYKPGKTETTDLTTIIAVYEKWLKLFPFELSFFSNIKKDFERMPLFNGKPTYNKYTGFHYGEMHTKESLSKALIELTNKLLIQVNGVSLYNAGLITEPDKIKIELSVESRKMKLKEGYKPKSQTDEPIYVKMIEQWFEDEKKFFTEITPLIIEQASTQKALQPNMFHYFDLYFAGHTSLMMEKEHHLFQEKRPTSAYFLAIRDKEDEVKAIGKQFENEIRNNALELNNPKRQFYLKQIQDKLNSVYEYIEHKPTVPELERLEFDSSIPSIQNLIRSLQANVDTKSEEEKRDYSNKQIAIAYYILDEPLTTDNAGAILEQYSTNTNIDKLLQKRVYNQSELTAITGNKSTDTKHLQDLLSAKKLLSGMNNSKAVKDIERIITTFQTNYGINY